MLSSALYTVPCPGTSLEKAGNKLEKKMWRKERRKKKRRGKRDSLFVEKPMERGNQVLEAKHGHQEVRQRKLAPGSQKANALFWKALL